MTREQAAAAARLELQSLESAKRAFQAELAMTNRRGAGEDEMDAAARATELLWKGLVAATAVGTMLAVGWTPVDAHVERAPEGKHEHAATPTSETGCPPSEPQDIQMAATRADPEESDVGLRGCARTHRVAPHFSELKQ